ncbi:hypothetical protein FB382_002168 [Nocardioides ginsengisegetis]|uniref:Uncharacterized protein n=1 Tax=Nocardioides ginsengisegetis TaxID=661491 RepID=A0A7W3P9Y0_9ACTN|nr:hypothetical protein [Nocardioides ginsengisegetis]MBA8803877.1 hypothetical protein [Nocardioides ginsengisegetis]
MRALLAVAALSGLLLAGCTSTDADPGVAEPGSPAGSSDVVSDEPTFAPPAGVTVTDVPDRPVGVEAVGSHAWAALPDSGSLLTEHGHEVPVGSAPLRLVATPAGVWVSVIRDGTLVRIDPDTEEVDLTVHLKPTGSEPEGLAWDGTSLWVVDQAHDRVLRVDPASGAVVEAVPTGAGPRLVALGDQGAWVADYVDASLTRLLLVHDCAAHLPECSDYEPRTIPLDNQCLTPQGLAWVDHVVWVTCTVQSRVIGVDEVTGKVIARFPVDHADAVVADGNDVYVVGQVGPTVRRIDTTTRTIGDPLVLDEAGPTTENVAAAIVGDTLVVSHPEVRRLYSVPLGLLRR